MEERADFWGKVQLAPALLVISRSCITLEENGRADFWDMTYSIEDKTPPKSTKSRNSVFLVHIRICTKISIRNCTLCNRGTWESFWARFKTYNVKRGQYQDILDFGGLSERNVASKPRYLRNVWKEPCTGYGFVTFVTFYVLCHILDFAKKNYKGIVTKFKNVT